MQPLTSRECCDLDAKIICDPVRGANTLPHAPPPAGVFNESAGAEDPAPIPGSEFHSGLSRLLCAHPGPHYVHFVAGDGSPAAAAGGSPLGAARGLVEAGGGRLLEVRCGGGDEAAALKASLR